MPSTERPSTERPSTEEPGADRSARRSSRPRSAALLALAMTVAVLGLAGCGRSTVGGLVTILPGEARRSGGKYAERGRYCNAHHRGVLVISEVERA